MSDWNDWNKETPEEKKVTPPAEDTPPVTASPQYERPAYSAGEWRSDAAAQEAKPQEPTPPQQPTGAAPQTDRQQEPFAGMPHQTAHPQPPQTQWYRSGTTGGATPPPYTGSFTTPPQPPKKRKHTGAIVALAVVGALAVLALTITVAFSLGRAISSDMTNSGSSVSDK